MEVFEKLKNYLNREIIHINNEINNLSNSKTIISINNIQNFISNSSNFSYDQIINLIDSTDFLSYSTDDIIESIKFINFIKNLINNIQDDITNLNIEEIQKFSDMFSLFGFEASYYIKNLTTLKNTYGYIIEIDFDDDIKQQLLQLKDTIRESLSGLLENVYKKFFSNLIKKFNELYKEYLSKEEYIKLKQLYTQKKELDSYSLIFDENGILLPFTTDSLLKNFLEFLKNSNLNEDDILELVVNFIKYNIAEYNKNKKAEEANIISEINNNSGVVNSELEELANSHNQADELEQSQINELDNFSDEEKKIIDKIKTLLSEHNITSDEAFAEMFKDDLSLESRKDFYINDLGLDWTNIVTDIREILRPNISNHKQEVFKIFRYIIDINEKYLIDQKQNEERIDKLCQINDSINKILESKKWLLAEYDELDKSQKVYLPIVNSTLNEGVSYDDLKLSTYIPKKPIAWIKGSDTLQKLLKLKETIKQYLDLNKIDLEDLQIIILEFNSLMSIMDSLEKELSIYLNEKYSQSFVKSNIKNIIYFLNDDFSNNSETEREELSKVTRYLLSTNWSVLSRDNMIEDLTYTTKSGKIKNMMNPLKQEELED